ncbi:MAG: MFS transporter [Candidatus Binatus sp.]|uniref:MFS transporter n=1 Tax=Candidatus Binatus sp. TaxID=2811406 RepID=UPI0027287AD3|nr:MFS transporter [Candidatus Binatus sp.]MDO8431509.1 MFS transporter [Candidatus Binatus sp.]
MAVEAPGHSQRKLAIAGMAGNILEWYDFSIYGFFAYAIGENFFPSQSKATSLIDAFGVFAAGFLMRPVGALLFGHVGDRYGRQRALTLSVVAMAIPTVTIGLLPTYHQIGVAAPVLLVILRLIQGLSVGGEYTTSVIFMIEGAHSDRRGMMGALGAAAAFGGVMLGSAVGAIVASLMSQQALAAWGWRLPFLAGITIGIAGYIIRRELRNVSDLPPVKPPPMLEVLRAQWPRVLQVAGFKVLESVGFYLMFVYAATYLTEIVGITKTQALTINTIGMAAAVLMLPVAGAISDRIGRKPMLLASAAAIIVFAWPLFNLMWHPKLGAPLLSQIIFATLVALFVGVAPVTAAEAFPANVRCTGVGLSHNLCMALLGGTAPMVATYLIDKTDNEMVPPMYMIAAAIVSALFVLSMKETGKTALAE